MEPLNGPAPASTVSVFLLLHNRLSREALIRLFRRRSDFTVVGESSPTDATPLALLESGCNVLVLDSFLTPTFREYLADHGGGLAPDLKIILIGMELDEKQFMEAIRSGAVGYLLKDACALDVIAAVRSVSRGEAVCPPALSALLFRYAAQAILDAPSQNAPARPDLTLRQQQLVSLVAKGLTNKEIASHLNISEFTVRNHIHRILKQVDAESRSEAVENIRSFGYAISG
jgi:two-component system nitrate/nitrite response regulator NarL